ncbi:hypothetical protein [Bradyrhizobium sp. 31Argb]|uniref:hypothetical protein n=1 Tax=Bradyrhizobium sp. 31Argb TaxID=3141247 RepID=UPI00374A8F66
MRFVDGVLPSLALLLPSRLFLCILALASLLFLLKSECGLPVGCRIIAPLCMLLPRLVAGELRAARLLRTVIVGDIRGQFGVLFERTA